MPIIIPALSTTGAFAAGWLIVNYLTVHPRRMSLYLILSVISLVLTGLLISFFHTIGVLILPVGMAVIGICSGYYVNTYRFLNQEDSRQVPEITRGANERGDGHTAIVYFTHGEPETYNPIGWLNQFREFDEQKIRFIPFVARPFFIAALRGKYIEAGQSNHRRVHQTMIRDLEQLYRNDEDTQTQFYLSFLDDDPRPDAAVIDALNSGADRIVVATVFLTISNHTAEGQNLINELEIAARYGVEVSYTQPLWNSDILKSSFIEKARAAIGETPKDDVAVAFVGHGQPDEWDDEWPTETEQEEQFRADLIELFVQDGYRKENLGSSWMEFKSPKPAELMDEFVKNGVKKICYFSTAISADAIHSQVDVPRLVNEYNFPERIELINLGAWNNHPLVIQAIKARIDEQL